MGKGYEPKIHKRINMNTNKCILLVKTKTVFTSKNVVGKNVWWVYAYLPCPPLETQKNDNKNTKLFKNKINKYNYAKKAKLHCG